MSAQPLTAGVLLFEQVEVLDFAGPFEVLGRSRTTDGMPCFKATTMGPSNDIECVDGLRVRPHLLLDETPQLDILVVPGGPGARLPEAPEPVLEFIKAQAPGLQILCSVCTGAVWLARAGLLDGLTVTTHPRFRSQLARDYPQVTVVNQRLVDTGKVITAGGVASGVDLALYLLERYYGWEIRRQEAIRLDGPWR
ncbi:MAG: DJ-1/PfpI family protein [Desulfarculaceae bacterium]|nr:DJ-1/PfpI family protein [Desulfarculaceae bacterium]MCF8071040.1 DJ-1/PfpI family protein [Desulfarculaceae bacterium]MCF8100628.1 DJ-1/PfpI family protein [Desulfarculaceae bacterium]MCF8116938.1 DJ-1/PfpI family protein [Desulfarculaceae bacterium]